MWQGHMDGDAQAPAGDVEEIAQGGGGSGLCDGDQSMSVVIAGLIRNPGSHGCRVKPGMTGLGVKPGMTMFGGCRVEPGMTMFGGCRVEPGMTMFGGCRVKAGMTMFGEVTAKI